MRINKYIAAHYEISRRKADELILNGRVTVNGNVAPIGYEVLDNDIVEVAGIKKKNTEESRVLLVNKPRGYVCSHEGQGAPTVFELVPEHYCSFNIAGRLDKDSSGLVILSNNGDLIYNLSHPSKGGKKVYEVDLQKPLAKSDSLQIQKGVNIGDARLSKMQLSGKGTHWVVELHEGRNRQIRRTFSALGYEVLALHRTQMGQFRLTDIADNKNYVII